MKRTRAVPIPAILALAAVTVLSTPAPAHAQGQPVAATAPAPAAAPPAGWSRRSGAVLAGGLILLRLGGWAGSGLALFGRTAGSAPPLISRSACLRHVLTTAATRH